MLFFKFHSAKKKKYFFSFHRTLTVQMFHKDFKQHLKAIETLSAYIDADLEGLIANLDLILKWTTLRFFETNPSVLLRALDYLNEAFSALADAGLPAALVGRDLRVPGGDEQSVRAALAARGIRADLAVVPATFEEAFVRLAAARDDSVPLLHERTSP